VPATATSTLFTIEEGRLDIVTPALSIIDTVGPGDVRGEVSSASGICPRRRGTTDRCAPGTSERCPKEWPSNRYWPSSP